MARKQYLVTSFVLTLAIQLITIQAHSVNTSKRHMSSDSNSSATETRRSLDFNSILDENTQIQKDLTNKLQEHLATKDLGKAQNPNFNKVGEDIIGREAENVAVETKGLEQDVRPDNESLLHKSKIEKTNLKRLSQEFNEVNK